MGDYRRGFWARSRSSAAFQRSTAWTVRISCAVISPAWRRMVAGDISSASAASRNACLRASTAACLSSIIVSIIRGFLPDAHSGRPPVPCRGRIRNGRLLIIIVLIDNEFRAARIANRTSDLNVIAVRWPMISCAVNLRLAATKRTRLQGGFLGFHHGIVSVCHGFLQSGVFWAVVGSVSIDQTTKFLHQSRPE